MTERGAPWSAQEIEVIVADYFYMLALEHVEPQCPEQPN